MRVLGVSGAAVVLILGIVFAQSEPSEKIVLSLSGLHCSECAANVEKVLKAVDGVQEVEVSLEENRATVTVASSGLNSDVLIKAVTDAGYGASVAEKEVTTVAPKKEMADACCSTETTQEKKAHEKKNDSCCTADSKKPHRLH